MTVNHFGDTILTQKEGVVSFKNTAAGLVKARCTPVLKKRSNTSKNRCEEIFEIAPNIK